MKDSLIGTYFDFGQALEFLKDGYEVTNETYTDWFRFKLESGRLFLTDWATVDAGNFLDNNGDLAYYESVEAVGLEDILNEKWYLYEKPNV